ncbi:uncharacterized protein N7482_006426 [Penicillium canariense]|uniref:Uncharacterized protein n=1 Tax=Penicillium canariense TaxID=189055 RepID=A0A9W9LI63_9EURO|nr:uncharacterized protein N7482_006426 [Penicillium canariense]KAJ5159422.1 hypothetical protein N7482_006426 [Penicillium canariense]
MLLAHLLNKAEIIDANTELKASKLELVDSTKGKLSKNIARVKEQADNVKPADTGKPVDKKSIKGKHSNFFAGFRRLPPSPFSDYD